MMPGFRAWDLDAELVFDRYLGGGDDLDVLQRQLAALAPTWSSDVRLSRDAEDRRPIEILAPGTLKRALMATAVDRGKTYRELAKLHGPALSERVVGSVELRGATREFIIVVSVDEMVVSRVGAKRLLGNRVVLQIRRPTVEGRAGGAWLQDAFESLCASLSPAWAKAAHPGEYWAKVMSDGSRVEAIGRDFARFLPGLFWLNFFGSRLRVLLGDDRLRSTPAHRVAVVDDGILVALGSDPSTWDTPDYEAREQNIRDHLGPQFFFSKNQLDRVTVAPDWTR